MEISGRRCAALGLMGGAMVMMLSACAPSARAEGYGGGYAGSYVGSTYTTYSDYEPLYCPPVYRGGVTRYWGTGGGSYAWPRFGSSVRFNFRFDDDDWDDRRHWKSHDWRPGHKGHGHRDHGWKWDRRGHKSHGHDWKKDRRGHKGHGHDWKKGRGHGHKAKNGHGGHHKKGRRGSRGGKGKRRGR